MPEAGDEVCTDDGIRLTVESLDKNRIESVHLTLPPQETSGADTAGPEEEQKNQNGAEAPAETAEAADAGKSSPISRDE